MTNTIVLDRRGSLGTITLNRPKALHALDATMIQQIHDAVIAWGKDPEVTGITIDHAAGTRGFCAGADIKALYGLCQKGDMAAAAAMFALEYRTNIAIYNCVKPYISFMDGLTMGGGVGVCIHGRYRIATEHTVFAMPECAIGLFPDIGASWFLPRLKGSLGMWLGLTGARLRGKDVLAAGLATHFCFSADLPALKQALVQQGVVALTELSQQAEPGFAEHLPRINHCFGQNSVEGIMKALIEDGSDWAQSQVEVLETLCPMSLKVTHRQLGLGKNIFSFAQAMAMEGRIANCMIRRPDFCEGVRAAVIDKDRNPSWMPASLADIVTAEVEHICL